MGLPYHAAEAGRRDAGSPAPTAGDGDSDETVASTPSDLEDKSGNADALKGAGEDEQANQDKAMAAAGGICTCPRQGA